MVQNIIKKSIVPVICTLILCLPVSAETVLYNPNSCVYHKISCPHAKRCKCGLKIDKKQAIKKGGRPCKTCGG